ncbi:hypothetical protein HanLR1_Chr05g0189521 [Helianthus annuus]|nr:hypothetical protein HanLR1_Chr05g0189521 [Helianthus annuus]
MKFLDWYLKIGVVSAAIGGSMEYFMINTGFCKSPLVGLSLFITSEFLFLI